MLENELQYFEKNRKQWVSLYQGKFVLIKGEELLGIFDKPEAALAEGARRFGLASFLVLRVEETTEPIYIPALTLGILRADPASPI